MKIKLVYGRRSVMELLEIECEISELYISSSRHGEIINDIKQIAQDRNIPIVNKNRFELDLMTSHGNHQGIAAGYEANNLLSFDELISQLSGDNNGPLILLDGVEDPHNFGAIIRSAEVLGSSGIIFRKKRAVGITASVIKASAGAALRMSIAQTANIAQSINLLKKSNYWVYGLDSDGESSLYKMDLKGQIAFVMGSEGKGLSQLIRQRCDALVHIPQVGKICSLNVSVSTGIVLSEWVRQNQK